MQYSNSVFYYSWCIVTQVCCHRAWQHLCGLWRSLVAHISGGDGVAGSNPVSPTNTSLVEVNQGCFCPLQYISVHVIARNASTSFPTTPHWNTESRLII